MRFGVVIFPGSNCDADTYHAVAEVTGERVDYVFHTEHDLGRYDCLILPGGFSYGDYLRAGAIAAHSPVMDGIREQAERGRLVLGICNGFQVLVEAGLLPGAMRQNDSLQFRCEFVHVRLENDRTPFTRLGHAGQVLRLPIAHMEGNYYIDPAGLRELEHNHQIVFRYCDEHGHVTAQSNPNGSLNNIAGIVNRAGNVLGMMPHPERASEAILGSEDGRLIFRSILEALEVAPRG